MSRSLFCLAVLCAACGGRRTEVAVSLASSRPVSLASLELEVTLDETAPSPALMLRERDGAARLPGGTLLEIPANASTATVLAIATRADGARRSAIDTVRVRRGQRVELTLRFEFGEEVPDGGPVDALPLGAACAVATDCASGFCVEGMCCDRACDEGACLACSVVAGAASDGVCGPRRAGTLCRASAGACDPQEACDGVSTACPEDARAGGTTACRAAIGACDLDDFCDGTVVDCPADQNKCASHEYCAGATCAAKKGAGAACTADVQCTSGFCTDGYCCNARCNAGACDRCDEPGNLGTCRLLPASTICHAATAPCDRTVYCDGSNGACPATQLEPPSTVCRPAYDPCDQPEYCTGSSAACPAVDRVKPMGTVCRPAAGDCDVAESCTGLSTLCPADDKRPIVSVSFFPASGTDGTTPLGGPYDPSVIEPSCTTGGGSFRYGLVSFETQNLPFGAIIDGAVLSICLDGGVGIGYTGLYTATYAIPVTGPGNTGGLVASMPFGAGGDMTVEIPASVIKTSARTQFQLHPDVYACSSGNFSRRYATATTTPITYPCTLNAQGTYAMGLAVSYCQP